MKLSRTVVAAVSAIALFAGCTKKEDAAAAPAPRRRPAHTAHECVNWRLAHRWMALGTASLLFGHV